MIDDIASSKIMQVATLSGTQPWICTVYFVLHEGCFYWLSFPERRHSKELARNEKAAIAIALKHDKPVIGVQAEGDVSVVGNIDDIETVLSAYVEKYGQGRQFVERFKTGENQHILYRFTPRTVMLFDELNNSENPYQEISVK